MDLLSQLAQKWRDFIRLTPQNSLYDRSLLWLFIILLVVGFIMVSSASIPIGTRLQQDPFYFAKRDAVYLVLSLGMLGIFSFVSIEKWKLYQSWLYIVSLILLLAIFIPGIGVSVNGSTRWIPLGYVSFQPAEFAKLALTCFLAGLFSRRYEVIRLKRLSMWRPGVVLMLPAFLLIIQPDLGSVVVLFVITAGMLFLMGANIWQFIVVIAIGGFGVLSLAVFESYRLRRLTSFMDPFQDPYGAGFQLSNSLMAFGRGEFWGKGLGNSIQKLEYLPEAHTDFVMAVLGEEFGFLGVLVIITLLALLVFRAIKIGREALLIEKRFEGFFAFGIAIWIFFQGFVNLGMAMGMLPTKGLTFPLVSYGGSSLMIMSIAIAILLRIDHENRLAVGGQAHLRED